MTVTDFIEAANKVHAGKYDYTRIVSVHHKEKVPVICPDHGVFAQSHYSHLAGSGCPKCATKASAHKRRSSIDKFVEVANKIHSYKYDYSRVVYSTDHDKVTIVCPIHGEFQQTPNSHLQGSGCRSCHYEKHKQVYTSTLERFTEQARDIHGERYSYGNAVYTNSKSKLAITCVKHGDFYQTPNNHLRGQGCPTCKHKTLGDAQKVPITKLITQFRAVHGDRYDYSKVVYKGNKVKVTITCPIHGDFEQSPLAHKVKANGCPGCVVRSSLWSYSEWEHAGNMSKDFEGFSLYILECHSKKTGEHFIKIGKTFRSIHKRFKGQHAMPYRYKVLLQVYDTARNISELETHVRKTLKDYRYTPELPFGGQHECVTITAKDKAIQMIDIQGE